MPVYRYRFQTLSEIYDLAVALSRHFPAPESVQVGVYELLVNAVEHGNLGIGYQLKTQLLREGRWEAEIAARQQMPEYAGKYVDVTLSCDACACWLSIADQGKGFDWERYLHRKATHANPHGRGLLIAKRCGFDDLSFNAVGNVVTCVSRFRSEA